MLQRVQRSNLSNLIYKRQLRSLGHWIQKDGIIRRFAFYTKCYGTNQLGRPRPNYNKVIQNITVVTTEELQRKVLNRQEWRKAVIRRFDLQPPG